MHRFCKLMTRKALDIDIDIDIDALFILMKRLINSHSSNVQVYLFSQLNRFQVVLECFPSCFYFAYLILQR